MRVTCITEMSCFLFFFQAEDGIRDATVTGVQTCALPISRTQGSWLVWIVGTISLMLSFYVIYLGTKVFMRFVWGAMILTWVMLAVYAGVLLSVNPDIIHQGMMLVQNIDYQQVFAKAQELGWTPGFVSI